MPHAKIASHQAVYTLKQLHAELAGKILDNKRERPNASGNPMVHVEAVIKLLNPAYSLRAIAIRRRKPNPWFKRGTALAGRPGCAADCLRTDVGGGDHGGHAGCQGCAGAGPESVGGPGRCRAGLATKSRRERRRGGWRRCADALVNFKRPLNSGHESPSVTRLRRKNM